MGGIRASAQIISYEVILSFLLILPLLFFYQLSFKGIRLFPLLGRWGTFIMGFPLVLIAILAETNRAPFDLTEGESELVRGFNTEFSSTLFVLLFLGEYAFLILFAFILSILSFNSFFGWSPIVLIFL
jgi:NADH-quinone oxidoreductase subunit H